MSLLHIYYILNYQLYMCDCVCVYIYDLEIFNVFKDISTMHLAELVLFHSPHMVICLDPVSSFLVLPVNIKFCSVVCLLNLTKLSATRFKDLIVFCKGCARQNGKVTRSLPLLSTMKKTAVILRLISLTLSCDACVKRPVYFHH